MAPKNGHHNTQQSIPRYCTRYIVERFAKTIAGKSFFRERPIAGTSVFSLKVYNSVDMNVAKIKFLVSREVLKLYAHRRA